jgi:hypothetical protein
MHSEGMRLRRFQDAVCRTRRAQPRDARKMFASRRGEHNITPKFSKKLHKVFQITASFLAFEVRRC